GLSSFDQYSADVGVNLRQPLLKNLWIDAPRMTIKVAKRNLKISEYDFAFQVMTSVLLAEQNYYNLIAARDLVIARQKAFETADRFAFETARKVQVGTLAPLEEKLAQSESARARAELIEARQLAV